MDNEQENNDIDKATGQPPPPKAPPRPQDELTPLGAPVDPRFHPHKDQEPQQEQDMPRGIPKKKAEEPKRTAKSASKTATKRSAVTPKKKKRKARKG